MVEDAASFRSKAQVLLDLSKALQFSPESLDENRKGKLSQEQVKRLAGEVARPALLTLVFATAPFIIWTWIKAGHDQLSFENAFPALLVELAHVNDLLEAHGKMGGAIMLGSIIVSLLIAVIMAFRVPIPLYIDLLDRKVEKQEGRVVAREESVNRPDGRDPVEKYFFSLRYLNMPVNLAAYRALENGSMYIVYLTTRSQMLVSIEPKMESKIEPKMDGAAVANTQARQSSRG
jgi:hypothetical protein